ncbi:hypothetical protein [Spiroplasma endosymbiont of Nebria brevicollis]|uniref:hypothetical protein n=1 Tax=Spiroplasma endosymbiont of Nebria brevicollis TaxID=3066284 RepID=UPI00313DAE1E
MQIDYGIINKIIDYYNEKFESIATYSMIENIIDSNIFLGENLYKNLISQLSKKPFKEINEKLLIDFKLNISEISKILEKDRRTVKNHISKELS